MSGVNGKVAIELTGETPRQREQAAWVGRYLRRAVALLPANGLREVTVSVVGDRTMSRLHSASHGIAGPTDVLTYELEVEGGRGAKRVVTEGQVVICASEARRRAGAHKISVERELLLYALHGLLHLCGMDDRRAKDFELMHAKEDEILEAIGVGATFALPEVVTGGVGGLPDGQGKGRRGR